MMKFTKDLLSKEVALVSRSIYIYFCVSLIVVLKFPSALTSVYPSLDYIEYQGSLCYIYVLSVW